MKKRLTPTSCRAIVQTGILLLLLGGSLGHAAARTALVIGNNNYKTSPLKNPVNDAEDMNTVLKALGFKVILSKNADRQTMINNIRTFGRALARSDIGLFYFSGHGTQVRGVNYLIPVGHDIRDQSEVAFDAVDAGRILAKMAAAGNPMNILILDACRDNPFAGGFRSSSRGLAKMDAPPGTIIAYATASGGVAEDGQGRNGTYTASLIKHLKQPGLHVRDIFNRTGLDVMSQTRETQVPWTSSSPIPDYYLAGGTAVVEAPASPGTGQVSIDTAPPGAQIMLNGRAKGNAPVELSGLAPGSYRVKASLDGYRPETKTVRINKGRRAVVTFYLDPRTAQARLYVNTSPLDSRVRILNIDPAYHKGITLNPGRYHIEVSKPGFQTRKQWVSISGTRDVDLYVELKALAAPGPAPAKTWIEPVTGMAFVWVPKGCFRMGRKKAERQYWINKRGKKKYYTDKLPRHKVCLDGFWMGRYEVTNRQYRLFRPGHNSGKYSGVGLNGEDQPVVNVSWRDAKAFIQWLNAETGRTFALPTEARWEYAARAGTAGIRYWGDDKSDACSHANVYDRTGNREFKFDWPHFGCDDGYAATAPVGRFKPNAFGLYDMLGNAWEWCEDVHDSNAYPKHGRKNPLITSGSSDRVLRGGSWNYRPTLIRSARRLWSGPNGRSGGKGFRLVALPGHR